MNNNEQENDQVNIQVYCTNIYNEALDFVKENGEEHFEGSILHLRNESGYNDLINLENANDIKNDNNDSFDDNSVTINEVFVNDNLGIFSTGDWITDPILNLQYKTLTG